MDRSDDHELLARLREADETAFVRLVDLYGPAMLRTAMVFTGNRAVAEEVVQETWLAVLNGIDRFEGRASLRTWVFRILVNRARTQAVRDRRTVPLSALDPLAGEEEAVPADRFLPPDHPRWPGHWRVPLGSWTGEPERRLLAAEAMGVVHRAIDDLVPAQRAVIVLRDVHGWSADEACDVLGLTPGNQRVLLHRARSRVRDRLEQYLGGSDPVDAVTEER